MIMYKCEFYTLAMIIKCARNGCATIHYWSDTLVTTEENVAACTLSKGIPHNHSVGANDIVWIICDGECAGEI